MEIAPPASVLILAVDDATARRLAAPLRQSGWQVATTADDLAADRPLDILVTDRHQPPAELWPGRDTSVGVVRIGVPGAADVCLPEDVTPRELALACRLLAEIVRLRRRQQTGSRLAERLAHEAQTDPLTGLANRRAWDEAIERRLATQPSQAACLCVAILDLDRFKPVNDAHGHPVGDEVLRAAARAFRDGLRQDDLVARLGGDEFGLLLWVSDPTAAATVVDRVRRRLPTALAEAGLPRVTASAGYAVKEGAGGEGRGTSSSPRPLAGEGPGVRAAAEGTKDTLFAAADAALRQAKQQGRDRTVGGRLA